MNNDRRIILKCNKWTEESVEFCLWEDKEIIVAIRDIRFNLKELGEVLDKWENLMYF